MKLTRLLMMGVLLGGLRAPASAQVSLPGAAVIAPPRKVLCVTADSGVVPDFAFLSRFGFVVTYASDQAPDLDRRLSENHVVILACETRQTQHASIWGHERELFRFVRSGGRLLFCAPHIGAWSMVWNAYPALLPVTPFMRSATVENFAQKFRWDREAETGRRSRVVASSHPVCAGLRDWPEFYEGGNAGSYNAYDFDRWAPKPHTEIALRTEEGDVALAFMPFEQGRTAFLLADLSDDAGRAWQDWPDRERFWGALIRHLDRGDLHPERAPQGVAPFVPRVALVARAPFVFRSNPPVAGSGWLRALTRTDWTMLADNQVAVNVSPTPIAREPALFGDGWFRDARAELGIGHVKYYPPVVQFESALSVDVMVGRAVLDVAPVPDAYSWQPHLVVNRLQSADGSIVVEKRQTVADDVVCVELRVIRGSVDAMRLRGFSRYHGFLDPVTDRKLVGQVEGGVMFGVATSAPIRWTTRESPLRYEGEVRSSGPLTVAFTAAMEFDTVNSRLDAVLVDPTRSFVAAFQKWDAYFREQVPAFRSDDPVIERMVYGAFLGYRINLYDIPYEPWRDPHSCPSKMHFDPQWEQDDVQAATIGKWLRDPCAIERQLLRPFHVGFMLNANAAYGPVDRATRGVVSELQQYSVPLREVYLFDPRPGLRRELIAAMLHEETENDAWIPVDPATGLFGTYNCLGMDDSPRWDLVSPGKKAEWFQTFERPMLTPEVNATIAHRAAFLSELLGDDSDSRAAAFRDLARHRKAHLREHLWSAAHGFFVDRVAGEIGFSDVITPMGFVPLLLGPFDAEVMSRIAQPLEDPNSFRTPFGLPTVARSHSKFAPASYWRGSVWNRTNWFAAEALYTAGLKGAAADLTCRWLALIQKNGADLREHFNPLTGEKSGAAMFTEGLAAVTDIYFKNVVGFRPTWGGFDFDPIALDRTTPSFVFGPFRYRGREITIAWNRATAMGELRIDDRVETWGPGDFRSFEVALAAAEIAGIRR